jgi:hypothetical protein
MIRLRRLISRQRPRRPERHASSVAVPVELPTPAAPAPAAATPAAASGLARAGMRVLMVVVAVLLIAVVAAPIALSSQDIVQWAGAPNGLGLPWPWDLLTFLGLDAVAAVCVGMVWIAAWRGEPAGAFGVLVWMFAAGSAYANWRHGTRADAPGDAWWFFPAMSLAGPALLEVTVRRVRRWVQTTAGRYEAPLPHFRLARWLVALSETAVAWRLAVTEGYSRPEDAITAARIVRGHRNPTPNRTGSRPAMSAVAGPSAPDMAAADRPPVAGRTTAGALPRPPHSRASRASTGVRARLLACYELGRQDGRPWTARSLAQAAGCGKTTASVFLAEQTAGATDDQSRSDTAPSLVPPDRPSTSDRPARPAIRPATATAEADAAEASGRNGQAAGEPGHSTAGGVW